MKEKTKKIFRGIGILMLLIYLAGITYFLFFAEELGRGQSLVYQYNLTPFREIKRFWVYRRELGNMAVLLNLGGNVAAFIPFGIMVPALFKRARSFFQVFGLTLVFTISIETIQLVTRVGSFDVDDMILNTIGGIIGYIIFAVINWVRRKRHV